MTVKHSFPHKPSVFICVLSMLICVHLCLPVSTFAQSQVVSLPYEINISVSIGEPKLTVFGWTSPQASIELRGQRVSELAVADQTGYFYFDRVFLPRPKPNYPEICLSVIDRASRISSFPTCLPPLPPKLGEIRVGPVLLPPTLSLERGEFLPGEQVKASGATFPKSKVTIFLANEALSPADKKLTSLHLQGEKSRSAGGTTPRRRPNGLLRSELIKKAYAFFLPQYEIQSDEQGNFEFNLPASYPQNWRIYATAEFQGSPSPKSVSLSFRVLSFWAWLWRKIKNFLLAIFAFLKPHWWWLVIIVEILLILLLRRKKISKTNRFSPSSNAKTVTQNLIS